MGPAALEQVLKPLAGMFSKSDNKNLLVGLDVSDDAAVYRIDSSHAVILTVDFFTPVVDDPYSYGAVAAANAMSDVYAMGGSVAIALNICGFPPDMPLDIISEILKGGAEKVKEAGGVLAGGHTVDDKEPKYGLSVMGLIHPENIMTKSAAKPGDIIIITKPLGTGIITTAAKAELADAAHIALAVENMAMLNKNGAEILVSHGIKCCTDITGFGLLGHALEIAQKSSVSLEISASSLPFLPGAYDYAQQWLFPGGSGRNKKAYESLVRFDSSIEEETIQLMFTPETSGGLIAAVPESEINSILEDFDKKKVFCRVIGRVNSRFMTSSGKTDSDSSCSTGNTGETVKEMGAISGIEVFA
ncbi:MAG: selenide, water dikinase SelD [Spirochaetia bacterium]|jgi:selenide,water dikinase|nr:selenide, water dikinase SelD [Spirochaetia bacterium]